MPACPKCGKEVKSADNLCAACLAEVAEEAAKAPQVSNSAGAGEDAPPQLTAGQRALAGAKAGALLGALYGGIYGLVVALILFAFAEGDTAKTAGLLIVFYACVGALVTAPLGALVRVVFPGKPKKKPRPGPDPAKQDTKIDHA